jgi:membrane-bound serine protease (ClpP class)
VLVLVADGPLTPTMGEYWRAASAAQKDRAPRQWSCVKYAGRQYRSDERHGAGYSRQPVRWSYVAPRGAIAGSAGTVITLAGHASAMAPETAIGAASPVGPSGEDLGETIQAKEKNILKATVRSLAARRSPAAIALAERTIETADAASAQEAIEIGLVDFIADDLNDSVAAAGRVHRGDAERRALCKPPMPGCRPRSTFIEQLLTTLTNPNIVFLLLTIGVQAILIELSSPGGWIAGFIGVVCLSLAAYGLGILPVNYFGLVFLAIAFVLFVLDIKAPTHGALTAAGSGRSSWGVG